MRTQPMRLHRSPRKSVTLVIGPNVSSRENATRTDEGFERCDIAMEFAGHRAPLPRDVVHDGRTAWDYHGILQNAIDLERGDRTGSRTTEVGLTSAVSFGIAERRTDGFSRSQLDKKGLEGLLRFLAASLEMPLPT